jgi:hypothetical protein
LRPIESGHGYTLPGVRRTLRSCSSSRLK